jgi:hypothetical protein
MDNQYSEIYRKVATSKLLEIIENEKDYQSLAFETAKIELENRQLNTQDLENIKNEVKLKNIEKQNIEKKAKENRKEVVSKAFKFIDYVDPLVKKSPDKSIKILVVLLSIIAIFKSVLNASNIKDVFQNDDISGLLLDLDILEIFYLPITIFLLWKRLLIGWKMLFLWLCYHIIMTGVLTYFAFQFQDITGLLANFITTPSLSTCIMLFVFYGGIFYFINKQTTKCLFNTNEEGPELIETNE